MTSNLTIATGWCVNKDRPQSIVRGHLVYKYDWMRKWLAYHKRQTRADFFLYESFSDFMPDAKGFDNIVHAAIHFKDLPFRHDWAASFIVGMQYAFLQGNHFLYIEQDCLVTGIPGLINWALTNSPKISYGYGEFSYMTGWAEMSCVFVKKSYLVEAITRMNESGIKDNSGTPIFETVFHQIFSDSLVPWPFGYGRKRPINFDDPIWYGHQMSDEQIEHIIGENYGK